MVDPSDPEDFWDIRGTTPVYPLFAYTTYWLAGESGYGVVVAQIILLALVAPAIYIALYRASPLAALLSGLLLALDPQTGLLAQQIATEGLYIPLLGLGLAGLLYQYQRLSPAWIIYTLGLLLGVGALTRPVGVFLIVPYAVFYLLLSRSPKRMLFLILGYLTILLALAGLNSWRFDYFAPYNTGGFYLATRLFGVGDLYDHRNGPQSERLYYLAGYCYLDLDQNDENLVVTRYLRQCLYYRHQMTFDEISQLYQAVYSEATQAQPSAFAVTMGQQLARYVWQSSDPSDLAGARALQADCTSDPEQWYSPSAVFCPTSPMPLARLQTGLFIVILAFSLLTRVLNFGLAGLVIGQQPPLIRWAWLCCLGLFAYHAVVTAAAGTILSRYITVTNPYTLIVLGIGLAGCLNWLRALPKR
jgi:4-amino-4-deoxy-L-arabinose transferase-like glycosyltransferase